MDDPTTTNGTARIWPLITDEGSGVNWSTAILTMNGVPVTRINTPPGAIYVAPPGLANGTIPVQIQLSLSDYAGNIGTASGQVVVLPNSDPPFVVLAWAGAEGPGKPARDPQPSSADVQKEIDEEEKALEDLQRMFANWQPGQTWKDYGLQSGSNPVGHKSKQFASRPKWFQDLQMEVEHDVLKTITDLGLGVFFGCAGYNPFTLFWVYKKQGFANHQLWLMWIKIEIWRKLKVLEKLRAKLKQCEERERAGM